MAQQSFTTDEFLGLVGQSSVMKTLEPGRIFTIVQLAMNPSNPKTQKIYSLLLKEKKRNEYADKKFVELSTKVINDVDTGIAEVKAESQRKKLEEMQQSVREEEEEEAAEILKSLE